jgi:hypothetical protein
MNRSKRSVEFQHYCKTLSCPQGHRGTLIFREGAGEILPNLQLRDRMLLEHPTPAIARATESLSFLSKFRSFNHELTGAVIITAFGRTQSWSVSSATSVGRYFLTRARHLTSLESMINIG